MIPEVHSICIKLPDYNIGITPHLYIASPTSKLLANTVNGRRGLMIDLLICKYERERYHL